MPASGRITYLRPTSGTSGFSGNKIGIAGTNIWLVPEKVRINFRQGIVKTDFVSTDIGEKPLFFYADRDVIGTIQVSGNYASVDSHTRNALGRMAKIDPTEDVIFSLDTGRSYQGNLYVLSDQNVWAVDERGNSTVQFNMTFQFDGQIIGDGMDDSAFDGDSGSGEKFTNLKSVTGAAECQLTKSFVDQREDRVVQPFIVVGIDEGSGVPLSVAINGVVNTLGANPTWQNIALSDGGIPLSRTNARWAGLNLIVGELVFDRNATDCKAHQIEYDVGFVVKGTVGTVVTGDSSSDPDNVCADLASGPFAARFQHWIDRTVPYSIILLPCVWDTNPRLDTSAVAMIGTINSNTITIDGASYAPYSLRFDGFKSVRKYTGHNNTSKYFGFLKFAHLEGGWTDGSLICARLVPLPLEGNQTVPSYTVEASILQLYQYSATTFDSIATLCENCYG